MLKASLVETKMFKKPKDFSVLALLQLKSDILEEEIERKLWDISKSVRALIHNELNDSLVSQYTLE